MKEFTLDFSGQSGVPSQWGVDVQQVVKWFHRQIGDLDGVQLVADRKRGTFNVMALSTQAENLLSSFKLNVEKAGKSFELPLKERPPRLKPPVWISIKDTCWGRWRGCLILSSTTFSEDMALSSSKKRSVGNIETPRSTTARGKSSWSLETSTLGANNNG